MEPDRGELIGPYTVGGELGRGGSGVVVEAFAPDGRRVAIKRIAGPTAALRDEAERVAAVFDPHLVAIVDVVDSPGGIALLLAIVDGAPLWIERAERGPLDPGEVVGLVAPIADALARLHAAGIAHGDVSPANILIGADGRPVLVDLPVGFLARTAPRRATAGYAHPDWPSDAIDGAANDRHALARVDWEALTGSLDRAVATRDPTAEAVAALLSEAMDPDGWAGGGGCADLAAALRAVVAPVPLPEIWSGRDDATGRRVVTREFGPRPPRPVAPAPSRTRRGAARVWLAVASALGVGLGAVLLVSSLETGGGGGGERAVRPSRPRCPSAAAAGTATAAGLRSAGTRLYVDLDGDGCPSVVVWSGGVLTVPDGRRVHRYDFRRSGLVGASATVRDGTVLAGDWDCDGADGIAFYEPATGVVHYFAALPVDGPVAAEEAHVAPHAARVKVRRGPGCDRVVVA